MEIIDIHTHAFADKIAQRAIASLIEGSGSKAYLDGTVSALLKSMDAAGITRSVVHSIATRPAHFYPILEWAETICSERVIPFLSVYPQDKEAASQVFKARDAGFKGIKLHPYYQNFFLDDPEVFPVYEALSECGLILFCHTGFDIAYPRDRRAAPHRIANLLRLYPKLNFVATHCGAWFDWDEVRTYLLGRPVRIETAFSLEYMSVDFARDFLLSHPKEYLLFGTDSPWADQSASLALVRSLRLGAERESLLLGGNARALLGLSLNR